MFLQSDVPVLVDLERFCVVIGQRCLEMDASLLLSSSAYSDYSDLYCMKTPWCDQNPVKWGLPGRYTRYTRKIQEVSQTSLCFSWAMVAQEWHWRNGVGTWPGKICGRSSRAGCKARCGGENGGDPAAQLDVTDRYSWGIAMAHE